jgi:FkbM family methyltransferase
MHGWWSGLKFVAAEPLSALAMAVAWKGEDATFRIPLRDGTAVHCRPYSSDTEVFWEVLVRGQFNWLAETAAPMRVMDCGANIGTATIAILDRWPAATVLALEPDPDNFRLLVQNTARYRNRVFPLRGALWGTPTSVNFDPRPFRDGRQWSLHVTPALDHRGEVTAFDVPSLMAILGWSSIDLLKIDIEGAETVVLNSAAPWLDSVECLAVELHNQDAVDSFVRAVGNQRRVQRLGELTIGWRLASASEQ